MGKTEKERLAERVARLQKEVAEAERKLKEQQRKDDTRRKILVGALVLKAVSENEGERAKLIKILDEGLSQEHDRRLFEDFGLTPVKGQPALPLDTPPMKDDQAQPAQVDEVPAVVDVVSDKELKKKFQDESQDHQRESFMMARL